MKGNEQIDPADQYDPEQEERQRSKMVQRVPLGAKRNIKPGFKPHSTNKAITQLSSYSMVIDAALLVLVKIFAVFPFFGIPIENNAALPTFFAFIHIIAPLVDYLLLLSFFYILLANRPYPK